MGLQAQHSQSDPCPGSPEGAGWEGRNRVEKASWEKRKKSNNWRIKIQKTLGKGRIKRK